MRHPSADGYSGRMQKTTEHVHVDTEERIDEIMKETPILYPSLERDVDVFGTVFVMLCEMYPQMSTDEIMTRALDVTGMHQYHNDLQFVRALRVWISNARVAKTLH